MKYFTTEELHHNNTFLHFDAYLRHMITTLLDLAETRYSVGTVGAMVLLAVSGLALTIFVVRWIRKR